MSCNLSDKVIVVGLGQIGKPLFELIADKYDAIGVDIDPAEVSGACYILHVCYPFDIRDFIGTTSRYMEIYNPRLTIINSTVAIGTTRMLHNKTGRPIVHSPVRGKHAKMRSELLYYTKFIGGTDMNATATAAEHFKALGMRTMILPSPESTELAKLTETSYFGLLIAWAQEVERYCKRVGVDYDDVTSFYSEIKFFPQVKYFPGVIGGHCVMPNIEILKRTFDSDILEAIKNSDELKAKEVREG